jgi:DNA polymerase III epsilon subunit-like protein
MRVLVFDTETTGLPKTKIMSPDTLNLWPHIVQFSYVIYDINLNDIVGSSNNIVKISEELTIPEESVKIHGITKDISNMKGSHLNIILKDFFYHLRNVDLLVGHNVSFDINMVKVELMRMIYLNESQDETKLYKTDLHLLTNFKNICCTLKDSIQLCKIETLDKYGKPYFKYPKLVELHQKLFESTPNNLHNSFNDILITLRCYVKMKHDLDVNEKCGKFIEISKNINLLKG